MTKIKLTTDKLLYNVIISLITFILSLTYIPHKIANSKTLNTSEVMTKEKVFKLIKQQSKESYDNINNLFYEFANLDLDDDLELVAKTRGGVHLGYFYVFDKDKDGNYKLIAERGWKVDWWDLENYKLLVEKGGINLIADIKIYEMLTVSGGSGLDVHTSNFWYIKDGKFYEAWEAQLYMRSSFKSEVYLQMGGYKFNDYDNKIYYWSSEYSEEWDENMKTSKIIRPLSTTLYIYKFDGIKFILESKNKCK